MLITILLCKFILPIVASNTVSGDGEVRSRIEYLIPTSNILVLRVHSTFMEKNLASLRVFYKI